MKIALKKSLHSMSNILISGVFILSTVIIIRTYFYDIYYIPSNSMEKTLLPGDVIVVKKLGEKEKNVCYATSDKTLLPIRRNDIIVFKFPNNPKLNFVKRCCGLPGDSLEIWKGNVIANGLKEPENKNMMYRCRFTSHNDPTEILDSLSFSFTSHFRGKNQKFHWYYVCDGFNYDKLTNSGIFEHLIIVNQAKNQAKDLYPQNTNIKNTRDNWGPVIVPYKGMILNADSTHINWYGEMVRKYEGHKISIEGTKLLIDGKFQKNYILEKNYFLMLGDNRHGSTDSRYWGFVPEDYLIGKAGYILFSKNIDSTFIKGIRKKRFLRKIL